MGGFDEAREHRVQSLEELRGTCEGDGLYVFVTLSESMLGFSHPSPGFRSIGHPMAVGRGATSLAYWQGM